jgi:glutamine synthetase
MFEGNGYTATDLPRVPYTLGEAVQAFDDSPLPRKAFGDAVVDHLLHFSRAELSAYDRFVTDYERARFFERG